MGARRAHPRSRGENDSTAHSRSKIAGSSPLARGKHITRRVVHLVCGLIPARAGKTQILTRQQRLSRAHPRSRGENPSMSAFTVGARGSSPLARGKRGRGLDACQASRLIPARAGKTFSCAAAAAAAGAHPRSRGENQIAEVIAQMSPGSSPLARGKPGLLLHSRRGCGLIPARAGKTLSSPSLACMPRAHPPSRGENRLVMLRRRPVAGSSPLARGKPRHGLALDAAAFLIPARAGKTNAPNGTPATAEAHPRSRGENHSIACSVVASRIVV